MGRDGRRGQTIWGLEALSWPRVKLRCRMCMLQITRSRLYLLPLPLSSVSWLTFWIKAEQHPQLISWGANDAKQTPHRAHSLVLSAKALQLQLQLHQQPTSFNRIEFSCLTTALQDPRLKNNRFFFKRVKLNMKIPKTNSPPLPPGKTNLIWILNHHFNKNNTWAHFAALSDTILNTWKATPSTHRVISLLRTAAQEEASSLSNIISSLLTAAPTHRLPFTIVVLLLILVIMLVDTKIGSIRVKISWRIELYNESAI